MTNNLHEGHRDRMRQKVMNNSTQLLDHELLEVLLYYAQPRKNTNELAHTLIKRFGNIRNVFEAKSEDLKCVKGVSDTIASFLKLFPRLFDSYNTLMEPKTFNVSNLKRLKEYMTPILQNVIHEKLYVIYVDEKYDALFYDEFKIDSAIAVEEEMDNMVKSIQAKQIKTIALAHNHPYGSCKPSQEDVNSTIKLKYMLKMLGIEILEHIIIGDDGYCSIMDIVDALYDTISYNFQNTMNNLAKLPSAPATDTPATATRRKTASPDIITNASQKSYVKIDQISNDCDS